MCGRFTIMLDPEDFQRELELGDLPPEFRSDHNVSPGRLIPTVIDKDKRKVDMFKWGFVPVWAKDPMIGNKMINARAETIAEKPSFKNAFQNRRCLILADGFYEWKTESNKKQPYCFRLIGGKPFTFAGIWEHWQDKNGNELTTCAIITTTPNRLLQDYHDRMPVILDQNKRWDWLGTSTPTPDLLKILQPFPVEQMDFPEKMSAKSLYLNREILPEV